MTNNELIKLLKSLPKNAHIVVEGQEPEITMREIHNEQGTTIQVNLKPRPTE